MKLYHGMWLEARVITWTLILERSPPPQQNLYGKKRPKFGAILTTFDFDRKYLQNGSAQR